MKDNSSIILEQLIKSTLTEQTGLVYDPINKKDNEDKGTADNDPMFDLGDMVMWGYIIAGVLSFLGVKYGFTKGFGNLLRGKWATDGWRKFKRLQITSMLRLYRGLANPANIKKFEKWSANNTDTRVILRKGNTLESLASKYKTTSKEIWETNKNGAFKGMSYADVGKKQIDNVLIKRQMSVKERNAIYSILSDKKAMYFIKRDIFKTAFNEFKRGDITAKEFIKFLSPENAKKLGPTIRKMEKNRAGNVTITYKPNP